MPSTPVVAADRFLSIAQARLVLSLRMLLLATLAVKILAVALNVGSYASTTIL